MAQQHQHPLPTLPATPPPPLQQEGVDVSRTGYYPTPPLPPPPPHLPLYSSAQPKNKETAAGDRKVKREGRKEGSASSPFYCLSTTVTQSAKEINTRTIILNL
ncbi:hypothetical protein E2C01_060563 [Portunus trituberculatus]|uniref:Uncharacterized protein n=1 Tax=Portunus trituberculatus TaxID=210409 RepID=A0A5B7H913_PORTR|nr:hypothetical protein [Portunus trituberculatus]